MRPKDNSDRKECHFRTSVRWPFGIVDLCDHFSQYPFEILRFSDKIWCNLLKLSNNNNRYHLWNYRKAFEDFFDSVEIKILARDEPPFLQTQPFILPKFLS